MKLWNSIMSGLLLAPLALAGCPSDDTSAEGTSTTDPGTTTSDDTTSGTAAVDSSSSGDPSTSTGEPSECAEPDEVIPPPPVDCSGATMEIDGSVIIEDGGDDPSILEGVFRVSGAIRINRTDLTDLNFMACVEEVGADVTIFGNDQLTNVDGLWSLSEIGTDFVFSQNGALVDFNGLPNITKLVNNLVMNENDSMTSITGFQSLVGIDGSGLDAEGNQIGGNITIQQNAELLSIDGLLGLLVVNGVLAITNNPKLCVTNIACVGEAIVQPATPPDSWSISGNDNGC